MILEFLESWTLFSHTYISALLIGASLSFMGVVVVARGNILLQLLWLKLLSWV